MKTKGRVQTVSISSMAVELPGPPREPGSQLLPFAPAEPGLASAIEPTHLPSLIYPH